MRSGAPACFTIEFLLIPRGLRISVTGSEEHMAENPVTSRWQIQMVPAVAKPAGVPSESRPASPHSATPHRVFACGLLSMMFVVLSMLACAFPMGAATPPGSVEPPSRGFVFSYVVKVKMPASSHSVHARIPLPATDEFQTISELRLQAPPGVQISEDSGVGPHYADFSADSSRVKGQFEVHVTFTVVRYERRVNLTALFDRPIVDRPIADRPITDRQAAPAPPGFANDVLPFLQADRWSPIDENTQAIAQQQTDGITDPLQKARAIFNYVISTAGNPARQRGVARKACDLRDADCPGVNSLFVSLARAAGIPARQEIGFSFPDGEKEGAISGYHSWAEFFVNGMGWIPLDASEAGQDLEKRDDFFGSIDARRVMIATGRHSQATSEVGQLAIRPPAALSAERLNDLVDPQVEIDGKPFSRYSADFLFQEADIAGPTTSRRPVFARQYEPTGKVAGA